MASAHDLMRALASGNRLEFFAHLNPKIWDVIGPQRYVSEIEQVMLNPQPLPPKELGHRRLEGLNPQPIPPSTLVGYQVFQQMATGLLTNYGDNASQHFYDEIIDWCGTRWPRRWPWPWPWPGPDPDPEPRPDWDEVGMYLGAALAAAQFGAGYPDGEMRDLFDKTSNALLDRALG